MDAGLLIAVATLVLGFLQWQFPRPVRGTRKAGPRETEPHSYDSPPVAGPDWSNTYEPLDTPGSTTARFVTMVGAALVIASCFVLEFVTVKYQGFSESGGLDDVGEAPGLGALGSYASAGRSIGMVVLAIAIALAGSRWQSDYALLKVVPTFLAIGLLGWHVAAMLVMEYQVGATTAEIRPAIGAVVGAFGWVVVAAGQLVE